MPDISGLELCARARLLRPDLPAIISSGLVTEELRARAAAAGVRCVLSKENLLDDLVAAVARALDDAALNPGA
jgi:CheY-like chemotaxis protein